MASNLSFYGPNMLDREPSPQLLEQWKPAVAVSVGGGKRIVDYLNIVPGGIGIYRDWRPHPTSGDDNLGNLGIITPIQKIEQMLEDPHVRGNDAVWLYSQNEPGSTEQMVEWELEFIRHCRVIGRRAVVNNWAMGNPPDVGHYATILKPLWDEINNDKDFAVGVHEYAAQHDIHYAAWWLIGRYRLIVEQAPNIQIIVTESGFDDLDNRYGGWRVLNNLPFLTPQQYIDQMIEAYPKYYMHSPNVLGSTLFGYGDNGGDFYRYNIIPLGEDKIKELANGTRIGEGTPPAPEIPATWLEGLVQPRLDYANVRAAPVIDATALGRILQPGLTTHYNALKESWPSDGEYQWMPLLFTGMTGYVREDVIITPPLLEESCEARIQQLEKENADLRNENADLKNRIDSAVEVLTE